MRGLAGARTLTGKEVRLAGDSSLGFVCGCLFAVACSQISAVCLCIYVSGCLLPECTQLIMAKRPLYVREQLA